VGGYELFSWLRHARGWQAGRRLFQPQFFGSSPGRTSLEEVLGTYLAIPAYKLAWMDQDELFYMRIMQEAIEPMRSLKEHHPWVKARVAVTNAIGRVEHLGSPVNCKLRYLVSFRTIPNFARAGDRAVEAETERQMTLAAIALSRFHLRHGNWPASLEALVPEFVAAVPHDYMAGKPLCYRLKGDGGYVLHSVGEDGKDDGGDPTPPPGTAPGLWSGRDAVWPSAATKGSGPTSQAQP
jgi:hypothetical protein